MLFAELAEIATEVGNLAGGAGWTSAGLAGLVLYWLAFHHLPAKDQQIEKKDKIVSDLISDYNNRLDHKDAHIREIVAEYKQASIEERNRFEESLKRVVDHCAAENASLRNDLVHCIVTRVREVVQGKA